MRARNTSFFAAGLVLCAAQAAAFGPMGHHTVGAIADRLIANTRAADEVRALLGSLSLENAAVWADCAKGVDPKTHKYVIDPQQPYPECAVFETPAGIAAMEDFVRRNDQQCSPAHGEEICHKGYHYTDIAIQHPAYDSSLIGARDTDIVRAIKAALIVLQGGRSPAPIDFKDKREALLVLAHYIGDLHQPLHVGAVYLKANGQRSNPDVGRYDPATSTHGGNQLLIGGNRFSKLHSAWDSVPASLAPTKADVLAADARLVAMTAGGLPDWPTRWATETQKTAQQAFAGVRFDKKVATGWAATLPAGYAATETTIKTERIVKAGARLSQILQVIWP